MDNSIIVLICGLVFIFIGIGYYLWFNKRIKVCTESTEGIVIENKHGYRRGLSIYTPIFSIVVNGIEYKITHYSDSNQPKYQIGDKETLYYNPNNPKQFRTKDKSPFNVGLYIS